MRFFGFSVFYYSFNTNWIEDISEAFGTLRKQGRSVGDRAPRTLVLTFLDTSPFCLESPPVLTLPSAPCCPLLCLPCIWPCRMRFRCRGSRFLCSSLCFDCLSTNNPCFANLPDLPQPCFSACACAEQGCVGVALGCLSF